MDQIIEQLKLQLIEALNWEDQTPETLNPDAPLFGNDASSLGLDSIDALEIIIILDKNYGIKLENPEQARPIFFSIRTLAEYIAQNRKK